MARTATIQVVGVGELRGYFLCGGFVWMVGEAVGEEEEEWGRQGTG